MDGCGTNANMLPVPLAYDVLDMVWLQYHMRLEPSHGSFTYRCGHQHEVCGRVGSNLYFEIETQVRSMP